MIPRCRMSTSTLSMLGLIALALPVIPVAVAGDIPFTTWTSPSGTLYALSPGVEGGSCSPTQSGMECVGPENRDGASASASGCGKVYGRGYCLVVPGGWTPPTVLPHSTSTLECENANYELSVEGGSCTPDNGEAMTCSDGGVNAASATCESGCGTVTGNGSCTVNPKP